MFSEIEKKIIVEKNPFDHAIIKNILPDNLIKKAEIEFEAFNNAVSSGGERYQKTKQHYEDIYQMPQTIQEIIKLFFSKEFISILEKKFLIENLKPDWSLKGGGMHSSKNGGYLKIHSDFIYKRKSKMRRVLNLIIYLNSNWNDKWNGLLELWDNEMKNCKKKISPILNNAIIFRTDVDSNHGFPEIITCPENISRKSIALYYYINEKNILPFNLKRRKFFHAIWKKRPGNKNDPTFSDQDSWFKKLKNKFFYRFF